MSIDVSEWSGVVNRHLFTPGPVERPCKHIFEAREAPDRFQALTGDEARLLGDTCRKLTLDEIIKISQQCLDQIAQAERSRSLDFSGASLELEDFLKTLDVESSTVEKVISQIKDKVSELNAEAAELQEMVATVRHLYEYSVDKSQSTHDQQSYFTQYIHSRNTGKRKRALSKLEASLPASLPTQPKELNGIIFDVLYERGASLHKQGGVVTVLKPVVEHFRNLLITK